MQDEAVGSSNSYVRIQDDRAHTGRMTSCLTLGLVWFAFLFLSFVSSRLVLSSSSSSSSSWMDQRCGEMTDTDWTGGSSLGPGLVLDAWVREKDDTGIKAKRSGGAQPTVG